MKKLKIEIYVEEKLDINVVKIDINRSTVMEIQPNEIVENFLILDSKPEKINLHKDNKNKFEIEVAETASGSSNYWDDLGIEFCPDQGVIRISVVDEDSDRFYSIPVKESWLIKFYNNINLVHGTIWMFNSLWLSLVELKED